MSDPPNKPLTNRENEVVALIAEGLNSRQIAAHLNVAYYTVRKHRSNILAKLDLHNAAELSTYAVASVDLIEDQHPNFPKNGMN